MADAIDAAIDGARNVPMGDAELRAVFDAAADAIVVSDEQGRILAFSAAAERLFGYRAAEVIGKGVELLMPEPHRSSHAGYMRRYLQTGEARIIGIGREVTASRANGEVFPIALSIGEALTHGRRRFVGSIRDLSSKYAVDLHVRSLETRLARVDRFNLMGEMAAGIAHEINQPLSAIATYAQTVKNMLLSKSLDVEVVAEICEKIDGQARRAGQVIQNMRKFIRQQDAGEEIVDVNRVIADIRNLIEADARAVGIGAVLRYGDALPPVRADALQLQQVVLNLTRNALDAMRGGFRAHGDVTVETVRAADGGARIAVTDQGPGVPKTLADNIFHPFVTTKEDGLGVGLAISRTIIQAHGGTLSFGDNPGGGAIFTIDLPAAGDGEAT